MDQNWFAVRDGDYRARWLYLRHYSAKCSAQRLQAVGNKARFVGEGEHLVLLTTDCRAVFVWKKSRYRLDRQTGVNCSLFRNEGSILSSSLITEAETLAWQKWPSERLYTFVNPSKVTSPNPGYCFICAGWRRCGRSKGGLLILEKVPNGWPGP